MQLPGGAPQVFMRTSGSAVANGSLSGKDLVFSQEDAAPPARGVNFNLLMILLVLRMLLLHVLGVGHTVSIQKVTHMPYHLVCIP